MSNQAWSARWQALDQAWKDFKEKAPHEAQAWDNYLKAVDRIEKDYQEAKALVGKGE